MIIKETLICQDIVISFGYDQEINRAELDEASFWTRQFFPLGFKFDL